MSLSLWLDLMAAVWNGKKDGRSALPEYPGPNPYYGYLAGKGYHRAATIVRRFWREDRRNKQRWIAAESAQHEAELELPRLTKEAENARLTYERERAADQKDAAHLNPPGRAYIPVVLYWLLLALLIGGDAAISYTAFLTIGDVTPFLVAALALMVVVAMVVIGHVIGDRIREGKAGFGTKVGLVAVVVVVSVVMTAYREQAQAEALAATQGTQLESITINPGGEPAAPTAPAPAAATAPAEVSWEFNPAMLPAFFMFLTVTMMGMVVPAILAYYVERRPRLLKVVQAYRISGWAKMMLGRGRRRFYRANQGVAAARAYRVGRHKEAQVRLNQNRGDIEWLMSAYANANMRRRGSQVLSEALQVKPQVSGQELLEELDWTYPEANRSATYWGKAPGEL